MTGKVSDAEKNFKNGNKLNSNMVKISSSKSILSYQNGSAPNVESRECTIDEGMPALGYQEENSMTEEPFSESQGLKNECLDLLRKKLISDLSLTVFSSDLENKLTNMEPIEINKERQTVIQKLLVQISQLSDAEKLLLYLKLPSSTSSPFDPLRQPLNPLGNRQEIQQTIVWIKTHLEEDSEISIPKQDVYDQYLKYCENVSMKPLSTADFGKVMKQVYPAVRPRRLGTRGNSRYCYSGMRNTCKLPTPVLPRSCTESSVSNGSGNDGSSFFSADGNKFKKMDKTKRKWKSSGSRSDKISTANRSSCLTTDVDLTCHLKTAKRPKPERIEEVDSTTSECAEKVGEDNGYKYEEYSDNSFSAFDIDCSLRCDFGVYLKKEGEADGSSISPRSAEEKSNGVEKLPSQTVEPVKASISEPPNKSRSESGTNLKKNLISSGNEDQTSKVNVSNNHITEALNGLKCNQELIKEKQKTSKSKIRRSASLPKAAKTFKKSYIPIQPKPAEASGLSVRFERNPSIPSEKKKEPDGMTLCDESDSQEPEEEIVRYFKHLDDAEISTKSLVDQAVKNVDRNSVQINGISQIVTNSKAPGVCRGNNEIFDETNQQILRSQSCFEVNRGVFDLGEKNDQVFMPRSQSTVTLPTTNEQHKITEPDSGLDGNKKKISHLRILLEKSLSSGTKNAYSCLKNGSTLPPGENSLLSNGQNLISGTIGQPILNGSNFLTLNPKPVDRNILKLNGLKVLSKGPTFVPQSPNTRTKFFSFTPISPGPQSPMKTPSTPSASPFVSPRNTPVPRCRQNSNNDRFLSPSDRKSALIRCDGPKGDFISENVFNFSKSLLSSQSVETSRSPTFFQVCRPRSYSTTNFYRSKSKKNSLKSMGFDKEVNSLSKNSLQSVGQTNFSLQSPFSVQHGAASNFLSSESLSTEVQKFLEKNSKLSETQAATIRSQSVPLNRMISETTWVPPQVSPLYSNYFASVNSEPTLTPSSGKFPEVVSGSEATSPKAVDANLSTFVTNGEITNLGSDSLGGEIFTDDPPMVNLNDEYFTGDFHRPTDENFTENERFNEESAFSNKLDLNSSGTFDGTFTSDSDSAITDSIKSYLPDFEGIDNKSLGGAGAREDVAQCEGKLFKNNIYEGGNDNLKDPVITSFKPVLMNEISSSPGSPVLNFFGTKINEDSQQLIEFFDFEN